MRANETRGECAITLDGAEYVMRPSHEAIVAFETATGQSLLELAAAAARGALSLTDMAVVVAECVRAWGRATDNSTAARVDNDRVAGLLLEQGLIVVVKRVELMLFLAATGGMTAKGELKATLGAATEAPTETLEAA